MFMIIRGLLVFISKRKHILFILLSLEFLVLCLYLSLFIFLNIISINLFFLMIFLTIRVCEGVLGLSILVSIIRSFGNDNIINLNILW